ncbi:MAG: transcriptional repressor [Aquamicrobium sp.]|uniref:Fur family transcriptional regulator n=2 Tax=Aquamicrobium sp. TaxID=1872579 RepID=UPI00349E7B70|nr:transcriptional repressor [Aquamicrobium sp.]MCO5155553.1 transcriptional repressor [Aquamicrobium sp.]
MLRYFITKRLVVYRNPMTNLAAAPPGATNRRRGRNRQLVLDVLERATRPMRAYELLELLREDGFRAPLQVYRALEQLIADGAVRKIESLSAFALCAQGESRAAFAICSACGHARAFHDPALDRALRRPAGRAGFTATAATVELSGLCERCAHE